MKLIPLANTDAVVEVSDEDYEELSQYHWYLKNGYACRFVKSSGYGKSDYCEVYMHKQLTATEDCGRRVHVHHADGNRLNNQYRRGYGYTNLIPVE